MSFNLEDARAAIQRSDVAGKNGQLVDEIRSLRSAMRALLQEVEVLSEVARSETRAPIRREMARQEER